MNITLQPDLEMKLRARAEAEGITVEAYVERLVRAEQQAEDELEALALEGFVSGESINPEPGYWEDKHRRLDERLNKTGSREFSLRCSPESGSGPGRPSLLSCQPGEFRGRSQVSPRRP